MLVDSIPSSDEAWLARAAEAESERLGSGDGDDADDSRARIAR
jgi:hypothetical protein